MIEDKKELLAIEETALRDISGVVQSMDTITEYEIFSVVRKEKAFYFPCLWIR